MQIIKPLKQCVIPKVYEYDRRYFLSVGVLSAFYFDDGRELCTEQHFWQRLGEEFGNLPLDYGMPKPAGEVLVRGHACAPEGTNITGREVWLHIGELTRKLYAIGGRYWRDAGLLRWKPSDPQPFSRLALSWENAFGGPGFPENPVGKGHAPFETEPGVKVHILPCLVDPANPQQSPGIDVRPVCFDAIPVEWRPRQALAGTYDEEWKHHHFPGFAPDLDWRMFHCAQEEQRLPPRTFFRGDEEFELGGMHPQAEVLRGQLPGIRSRVFLNFTGAPVAKPGNPVFTEVGTQLDTVTFFPGLKMGVLCWRGVTEVFSEDTIEIGQLLVAYENLKDAPRPLEHYREENEKRRFRPGRLPTAFFYENPLIPEGARSGMADLLEEAKKAQNAPIFENARRGLEKSMQDIERVVKITGTEKQVAEAWDKIPVMPELTPETLHTVDIEGYFKKLEEYSQKQTTERDTQLSKLQKIMGEQMLTEPKPLFRADRAVQALAFFEGQRGQPGLEALDKVAPPEVMAVRFAEVQELTRQNERSNGHLQPKFRLRALGEQRLLRARLEDELRRGNSVRDGEFSACDFSGHDFSGADLRGIDLRSSILTDCNFAGADLREAILTHADLRGADCRGAFCAGCGFAGADLRGATFAGADLREAGLSGALLSTGDFSGAYFEKVQLMNADWTDVNFTGAVFTKVQGMRSDFSRSDFTGAKLLMCTFMESPFVGCVFRGADIEQVAFINQPLNGANFRRARLHRAMFTASADMEFSMPPLAGCDFAACNMDVVNFQDNDLREVNFKLARLHQCSFMNSDLRGACLRGCDARGSVFRRSNLEDANLSAANLAGANFRLARLVRTNFTGSNLIQAELLKTQLGETNFAGALLERTIMRDWRPDTDYGRREKP